MDHHSTKCLSHRLHLVFRVLLLHSKLHSKGVAILKAQLLMDTHNHLNPPPLLAQAKVES
jgi:hypothetical protein